MYEVDTSNNYVTVKNCHIVTLFCLVWPSSRHLPSVHLGPANYRLISRDWVKSCWTSRSVHPQPCPQHDILQGKMGKVFVFLNYKVLSFHHSLMGNRIHLIVFLDIGRLSHLKLRLGLRDFFLNSDIPQNSLILQLFVH